MYKRQNKLYPRRQIQLKLVLGKKEFPAIKKNAADNLSLYFN
jgi:hypothetical protein